ncbi:MAG: hypothetical protein ACE5G3_09835 [Gammaproteobacteria bacterium]
MHRMIFGLALSLLATGAFAAPISQPGIDVTFSYDDASLFGTGTVVGNSIFFSPTTFKAESLNTAGVVTANETLNITVSVNSGSGFSISEFQLVELGDYLLTGTSSSVDASGRLQVTSNTTTCGLFFSCLDSQIFTAGPLTTTGVLTAWSASAGIDLADTAGWGSDTSVLAQIQNDLTATSTVNGESALVQKKFQGVGLVVNPIPVPAAAWLFVSALGLLGWLRRKAA